MASSSAVSMSMPLAYAAQKKVIPGNDNFFKSLPLRATSPRASTIAGFQVKASLKEEAVTGLTAAALTASMIVPDVAEAASGVSPSLKSFLLSIVAGGIVLVALVGAVIGVSNFDPVKRS